MARIKEPYYFATDFPGHRQVTSEPDYLSLFAATGADEQILGEASAGYLYSTEALPNIRRFCPSAKLIIMLRDPIEMLQSLHAQFVFDCDEDVENFERAWNLQPARREGRDIPPGCRSRAWLQYLEVGQLGRQVERAHALFPRENILHILLEEFAQDPKRVYGDVLQFLDQPDDGRTEFPAFNQSKKHRFRFASHWPRLQRTTAFRVGRSAIYSIFDANLVQRIGQALSRIGNQPYQRPPLDENFRKELETAFADDTIRLQSVLGRPLPWQQEIA